MGGNHGYPYTTGGYGFATQGLSPTSCPVGDTVKGSSPPRKSSTTPCNVSRPGMNSFERAWFFLSRLKSSRRVWGYREAPPASSWEIRPKYFLFWRTTREDV